MNIDVQLFAILKDRAGVSLIRMKLSKGKLVSDAVDDVVKKYPSLGPFVAKIAYAVNQEYASMDTQLHEGDELALIPPVSGG